MEQQTYPWILTEKSLKNLEIPSFTRLGTWPYGTKKVFFGILDLIVHVFQGARIILVALVKKALPGPFGPMIMFATLPFLFVIPLSFMFSISEYYPEFRYYWLMNGSSVQSSITILLLYIYRGHGNIITFIKLSLIWGFITPVFMLLFQDNNAIFINYEHALYVYTFIAYIIIGMDMVKYWNHRING